MVLILCVSVCVFMVCLLYHFYIDIRQSGRHHDMGIVMIISMYNNMCFGDILSLSLIFFI